MRVDTVESSSAMGFLDREAPETSGWRSQPSCPIEEAVALLTTCLALVRPVGFTDDNAKDWLRVAAREVAYLPPGILSTACADARRAATHHAQIIPLIIESGDKALRERRRIDEFVGVGEAPALPPPPQWAPDRDELEAIKANAAAMLSANRA